ncbi:glycosyltransferase, group 1 family protein [Bifidobacterium ramosum]|uniref:Glycosyltransferase n=1 Tax=Bifidobacterium ramosum TaxID=1798158 RepID=A0A6L4X2Z1_9BIFI|nr:glycosyltransferase family 4 protein [Bifidobacterium ramosum]KAB8289138.1 glycosyltransferase, group 1 family protein [Bifidobacterium ramosum]NEG70849.1 glycosyltransferase [Bifidobacterium ramosum]
MNTAPRTSRHIAFFSGDITRSGGTERVATTIANALVARYVDTDVNVAGTNATNTADVTTIAGEPPVRISFVSLFEEHDDPCFPIDERIRRFALYPFAVHGVWRYAATVAKLFSFVRRQQVDVLVDIDGILDLYALPVKRLTGVSVVSWEHFNCLTNPDVPYRELTRRWAARRADRIVTLTDTDRALYERRFATRRQVVAIPNPMPAVTPAPTYDAGSRLILSAGRLTRQKGFDLLVDVAARVLPDRPDWRWVILGDGEDRPMLERRIADAGLDGRLTLAGQTDDMDGWMRRAAMFVLTSRYEGLPMVLLEAKAHRLPIAAFDCPTGPADIVTDGLNGWLVDELSVTDMARCVASLMDDEELRRRFARHALDDARRFDRDAIVTQWAALLDGLPVLTRSARRRRHAR